ncbi:MAG: cytochrome c3 family protein [bacterium]|nr:cytochrome c3 family protein [bacterium]
MKAKKIMFFVITLAGILAAVSAKAQGILGTKHNLSTSGTGVHTINGTNEVCVFCHTPHGADTGVAAPLWNRAQTAATFTVYSSATLDSLPNQPTGTSLACLSCHDGTIAFDAIRNLPGSGGYNPAAPSAGWIFSGGSNTMSSISIANLGTDLRNDHPISMVYADAKSPSSSSANQSAGFRPVVTTGDKKCVGAGISDCNSPNALPLSSATIGGPADYVQCTSCHDPHRSDTPTFLRKSNADSALCLTCHIKDG